MHLIDYFLVPFLAFALILIPGYPAGWWSCLDIPIGVLLWTAVEYWLHRILHWPRFKLYHMGHHVHPEGIYGARWSWVLTLATVPLCLLLPGLTPLTQGFLAGYGWFLGLHWVMHHVPSAPEILGKLHERHEDHHCWPPAPRWFGVTTSLWDRVFGTAR